VGEPGAGGSPGIAGGISIKKQPPLNIKKIKLAKLNPIKHKT
jgi:hypothetical protein